jgi:hypothetical protein
MTNARYAEEFELKGRPMEEVNVKKRLAGRDVGLTENYALILSCNEIDRHLHNQTFIREISEAFGALGVRLRPVNYRSETRELLAAMEDEHCRFVICFNGFGSELEGATRTPGISTSVYSLYGKPLFDFFHDDPAHETMGHQIGSRSPFRNILITDYGYLADGGELGLQNMRFVPSITFPAHLNKPTLPLKQRSIGTLMAVGLTSTDWIARRHVGSSSYRATVYRALYEHVIEQCVDDLRKDPRVEVRRACEGAGVAFDLRDPDSRFLLSSTVDMIKVRRRVRLLEALVGEDVTVVNGDPGQPGELVEHFRSVQAQSFPALLNTMAESQIVLCPLPHMTGFHERAMGAFTAGALVLAAPNDVLDTNFSYGKEFIQYEDPRELSGIIQSLRKNPDRMQEIASAGQRKAMAQFPPSRFAETVMSLMRIRSRNWQDTQSPRRSQVSRQPLAGEVKTKYGAAN